MQEHVNFGSDGILEEWLRNKILGSVKIAVTPKVKNELMDERQRKREERNKNKQQKNPYSTNSQYGWW
jgi:hypothetical protein